MTRILPAAMAALLLAACAPEGEPPAPAARQVAEVAPAPICEPLPAPILALIAARKDWRMLAFDDLRPDDKTLWMQARPKACPGFTKAVLSKGAEPSYAVALVAGPAEVMKEQLVVFIPTGDGGYRQDELVKPAHYGALSVVWTAPPGVYEDADSGRSLRSEGESIAFEVIEAGVLQFVYDGHDFTALATGV